MIGLYNVDGDLYESLTTLKTIKLNVDMKFPELKGLFIDWIDTLNKKKPSKEYVYQAALITYYSKKNVPIVIFDRYMCITTKEFKWLTKYNTHLYEPALNHRTGFYYQPHWIKLDEERLLNYDEDEREYVLGHTGPQTDAFNKYYNEYHKAFPDVNFNYKVDNWKEIQYMIAVDSKSNYNIGYLNHNIIDAMVNGCMIFCPIEHKYFSNMFTGTVVKDVSDIMYWTHTLTQIMRIDFIISIYRNIRERYPEFTIENTIENMFGGVFK